jgi:hypothetical protein
LYSDFLLDVSALRGNRWIRKGAGARVRKKVEAEKLNVEKPAQNF